MKFMGLFSNQVGANTYLVVLLFTNDRVSFRTLWFQSINDMQCYTIIYTEFPDTSSKAIARNGFKTSDRTLSTS